MAIECVDYRASFNSTRGLGRRRHSEVRVWNADDRILNGDPTGGPIDIRPLQCEHFSHANTSVRQ